LASRRNLPWTALAQSVGVAVVAYVVAGATEIAIIDTVRPSERELAWISDLVLAAALGVAVYLWRHLQASRQELAARERAELVLQTQLSVAADIQRRLLPRLPPQAHGVEWAASLHSAGRIGGDFYDVVEQVPGRWLLLAADVSGKGIPAALALGSLRAAFRTLARDHDRPARVLGLLSDAFHQEWQGAPYVTGIVARVDTADRTLAFANAGHPAGVVIGRAGVRHLEASGPPAGLLPGGTYAEQTLPLEPGDICLFFSDGVTEAIEDGAPSPIERIVAVASHQGTSAQSVCDAVMSLALGGSGPPGVTDWNDDRTVVVVAVQEATSADGARRLVEAGR